MQKLHAHKNKLLQRSSSMQAFLQQPDDPAREARHVQHLGSNPLIMNQASTSPSQKRAVLQAMEAFLQQPDDPAREASHVEHLGSNPLIMNQASTKPSQKRAVLQSTQAFLQ